MIWDASDANPMHRRIPAEITSRRQHKVKKVPVAELKEAEDEVFMDLKAAIELKPEARAKWLTKACKMVIEARTSSTILYDIVVSRKFASGLSERVCRKLMGIVMENKELFSEGQQRHLSSSDCPLLSRFEAREDDRAGEEETEAARREELRNMRLRTERRDDADAGGLSARELAAEIMAEERAKASGETSEEIAKADAQRAEERRVEDKVRRVFDDAVKKAAAADKEKTIAGGWATALDDAAIRRQVAQDDRLKLEKKKLKEKSKKTVNDVEAAEKAAADEEEANRRKLEEEADNIFMRVAAAPPAASTHRNRSVSARRSRSGSNRSISSRTARRRLRKDAQARKEREKSRSWGGSNGGKALTGSRAIFLNPDFVEDLPHLPRPNAPGTQGVGSSERSAKRSRSRDRRRTPALTNR